MDYFHQSYRRCFPEYVKYRNFIRERKKQNPTFDEEEEYQRDNSLKELKLKFDYCFSKPMIEAITKRKIKKCLERNGESFVSCEEDIVSALKPKSNTDIDPMHKRNIIFKFPISRIQLEKALHGYKGCQNEIKECDELECLSATPSERQLKQEWKRRTLSLFSDTQEIKKPNYDMNEQEEHYFKCQVAEKRLYNCLAPYSCTEVLRRENECRKAAQDLKNRGVFYYIFNYYNQDIDIFKTSNCNQMSEDLLNCFEKYYVFHILKPYKESNFDALIKMREEAEWFSEEMEKMEKELSDISGKQVEITEKQEEEIKQAFLKHKEKKILEELRQYQLGNDVTSEESDGNDVASKHSEGNNGDHD